MLAMLDYMLMLMKYLKNFVKRGKYNCIIGVWTLGMLDYVIKLMKYL